MIPDHTERSLADLLSLRGRRAVVTGGGRGIGAATVRRLAEAGADVVAADLDEAAARDTAATVNAAGGGLVLAVRAFGRGKPDDIARVITVLASDLAAWITGDVVVVDAGSLLR